MRRDISQPPLKTHGNLQAESPLSPYRALVVQFRPETEIARGCVTGRVERAVSGQATHFGSLEELLAFVERVLATVRAPPHRRGKGSGTA